MRSQHLFVAAMAALLATTSAQPAVKISQKPTQNMNCSGGVCTPTAKKAVLNVGDLANMLASGDGTVTSGSNALDIEIDAGFSWTNTNRLTLDSYRSIELKKALVVAGTGALTITTNDGGKNGVLLFASRGKIDFSDITSKLVIDGNNEAGHRGEAQSLGLFRLGGGLRCQHGLFLANPKIRRRFRRFGPPDRQSFCQ